jgi:hypothetical protein
MTSSVRNQMSQITSPVIGVFGFNGNNSVHIDDPLVKIDAVRVGRDLSFNFMQNTRKRMELY